MQRLSTIVIQKLLDGFFLGLDVVDEARRRIDRLMGRPEEAPFEVVWPEAEGPGAPPEEHDTAASSAEPSSGDNGRSGPASPAPAEVNTPAAASAKGKAPAKKKSPAKSAGKAKKRAPASRPKVRDEVDALAKAVEDGTTGLAALDPDRELGGKRMIARVVYALAAAHKQDLAALSSTEIAHVLTFGLGIETFGTNISRAIRQGTAGLVEAAPAKGPKRYRLSQEGHSAAARAFAST